MAKIPAEVFRLKTEIAVESGEIDQGYRPYFGISGAAVSCQRAAWYSFRWCTRRTISKRMYRLFNRGHREEQIIIADLKAAGMKVHSCQITGTAGHGHIKGHPDGIVENVPDAPKTPHLLEIKTANDKNFKSLVRHGVKKAKPVYYGQCQGYMKLFKLKRALFIAVNKNDDARYYERIRYDRKYADDLFQKSLDIITSEYPPPKIGKSTWWECKLCDHYDLCHWGKKPERNCRTCHNLDMHDGGIWRCSLTGRRKITKGQRSGCRHWTLLEGLQ